MGISTAFEGKRNGAFFSLDALIAVMILFIAILMLYPLSPSQTLQTETHRDILSALSALKIGEIDNAYAASLIAAGAITDANKTVLEQIGEFYITDREKARNLAAAVLNTTGTPENIGIWYENTLVYSRNTTPFERARTIKSARQSMSGIREGSNLSGFTARAALSNRLQQRYAYFGGYVGDGNITLHLEYAGNITNATLEVATNTNFSLIINGNTAGTYAASANEFTPAAYVLPITNFQSGNTTLELRSTTSLPLHVAGGFVKIVYESDVEYARPKRQHFPGVQGLVNIYDGVQIPANFNSMSVTLHYNASQQLFFTLGNVTLWNGSSTGETTVILSNSTLASALDYSKMRGKTLPLRLALKELPAAGNADIILITDLSASMNDRLDTDGVGGVARNCTDSELYNGSTKRISLAQCLDKLFIDIVLNASGNRLGLVGFYGDAGSPNKGKTNRTDFLTANATLLKSYVDGYTSFAPRGLTCICCAINSAYKILDEHSNSGTGSDRQKMIVVMSDGVPTHGCGSSNDYQGLRTGYPSNDEALPISSQCSTAGTEQCTTNNCIGGLRNANFSACLAHTDLGATLYSVGFGPVKDCHMGNDTLTAVARCGGGAYYASANASELAQIYRDIAENTKKVSYDAQVANASSLATRLYPDSYIEFDAPQQSQAFGLISTLEQQFSTNSSGSFSLPADATLVEAKVTSYSGPRWTSLLSLNAQPVYNLSSYGENYTRLGDPFVLTLPSASVNATASNTLTLTTGIAQNNISSGSQSNKIIYTFVKNASAYAPLAALALGCNWIVMFEDNTNITTPIPTAYTGSEQCSYTPSAQTYTANDALQASVFLLLQKLDFNNNQKVEVKFREQELDVQLAQVTGIPYSWSTEVQVRVWN